MAGAVWSVWNWWFESQHVVLARFEQLDAWLDAHWTSECRQLYQRAHPSSAGKDNENGRLTVVLELRINMPFSTAATCLLDG